MKMYCVILSLLLFAACDNNVEETVSEPTAAIPAPQTLNYSIVNIYPHDTASYTQGLIWENNMLYEGTGLENESKLRINELKTGKATKSINLPNDIFGEGITMLNGKIYQLTWNDHIVYVYDAKTFKKEKEFAWPLEGWGITNNGKQLIISTGSSNLYFVNPETFKVERTLGISDNTGYIDNLNELEFVNGSIYANRYQTNYILKIDPTTGTIVARADLKGILEKNNFLPTDDYDRVLNGIAYNAATQSFYITGKKWPALFELKFN
jgi:glutamine cyclotransferase